MDRYAKAKTYILERLRSELPKNLYYHGFHHVLDVLQAAEMIGAAEKITAAEMELLKVAVLFHDSGFTVSPVNHEEIGCRIAQQSLPQFGYTTQEIEIICRMIMATRYPHHPATLIEQIICDADLDYLGRDDFFTIGKTLYKELGANGRIGDEQEWNELQEKFLSSHRYFTETARGLREAGKQQHLEEIRKLVKTG